MTAAACWVSCAAAVLLCLLLPATQASGDVVDVGFDLLFESNTVELSDVPINFDSALPTWLTGTLVSHKVLLL